MTIYEVVLRAEQSMYLGTGKGSGFSTTSLTHVPASTFRGSLAARWWRNNSHASQATFDVLIASVRFGDLLVAGSREASHPLDRSLCKYPVQGACPAGGYDAGVTSCPICSGRPEQSKGSRNLPQGPAALRPVTRVALDETERARDDQLYRRESFAPGDEKLVGPVSGSAGDLTELGLVAGLSLRLGAQHSVAGKVQIEQVRDVAADPLAITGTALLRIELLTSGVYVDDFGFPLAHPTVAMLRQSLQLEADLPCHVVRGFTRWSVSSGWHSHANVPKSADPAVIPMSVFHVEVGCPPGRQIAVPSIVPDLGLRTLEGCGWAEVSVLTGGDDA